MTADLVAIGLAALVVGWLGADVAAGLSTAALVTFGTGIAGLAAAALGTAPTPENQWRYRH